MKVSRKVEPNIFYSAEAFHISAELLQRSAEMQYRGAPFIVNASFALELYLKCFNASTKFSKPTNNTEGVVSYAQVSSEGNSRGHQLKDLFNELSNDLKDQIRSEFSLRVNGVNADEFFLENSRHFINWRYSFERNAETYIAKNVLSMLNVLKTIAMKYL